MGELRDQMVSDRGDIGFLFPGQGAQYVGMGQKFFHEAESARRVFQRADEILGRSISKLCFEGPEEELTKTVHAQVALFTFSIAALEVALALFPSLKPSLACGLSLGEWTALVALESITFEDGLRLVERRGELMEEAAAANPGTMASVIGLSLHACETVCDVSGAEIANLNSPEQIVLSGTIESIERACALAHEKGAKKVIPLKVSGAFHSSLMKPAEVGLREALAEIEIRRPKACFIANATGEQVSEPEVIRELLAKQLTQTVQWVKTMVQAKASGITRFLEIGAGRVLKGLARKIDCAFTVLNLEQPDELEQLKPLVLNI